MLLTHLLWRSASDTVLMSGSVVRPNFPECKRLHQEMGAIAEALGWLQLAVADHGSIRRVRGVVLVLGDGMDG
jgi:hypothetical protein